MKLVYQSRESNKKPEGAYAEGWTQKQIAQALQIRYETVQDRLKDY